MGTELGLKPRTPAFRLWSGHYPHQSSSSHVNAPCPHLAPAPLQPSPTRGDRTLQLSLETAPGNSLVVQWLGLSTFTARPRVRSLVRELRSRKLHSTAKKKRKEKKKKRKKKDTSKRKFFFPYPLLTPDSLSSISQCIY